MGDLGSKNNVRISGVGSTTLMFAHGFGCDQNVWRFLSPEFEERYRVIRFDLTGSGLSDHSAYDYKKYGSLNGYADDVLALIDEYSSDPVVFVGHSVSAMIGLLVGLRTPERIRAHVMIGPSPCYVSDSHYDGGFTRVDIDSLLDTLEGNYLGWAANMAPVIMGAADQPELGVDLTNSFCRMDPAIAAHFARVTFLSDTREELAQLKSPTLILQCTDDIIAPISVGAFMAERIPKSTLRLIENVGHCPHLSSPAACITAITEFLATVDS